MTPASRAQRLLASGAAVALVVVAWLAAPQTGLTQTEDPANQKEELLEQKKDPGNQEGDPVDKNSPEEICGPRKIGESCGPGNDRQTPGGGEKVSHKGWPKVSGILWIVQDSRDHKKVGGPDNDELLGHHGSDKIWGKGGRDIIWGDWDPKNNNERQRDVLFGGTGNDFLYPSHGPSKVEGGPGNDYVWAYYGRGTIDCGPGNKDRARTRLTGNSWRTRRCETVGHFCSVGPDGHGGCLKPGEKRRD